METLMEALDFRPPHRIKSYYVVWKLSRTTKSGEERKRLNRTMQYGNLSERRDRCKCGSSFKSYCVVWKLFASPSLFANIRSLNRTMQYGNLTGIFEISTFCAGLNRTMQYGNRYTIAHAQVQNMCLNRTMQYGNYFPVTFKFSNNTV